MISKGNHIKFTRFVLLAVSEEIKTWLFLFRSMYDKTSASADNPYIDLDYSGYNKNRIK